MIVIGSNYEFLSGFFIFNQLLSFIDKNSFEVMSKGRIRVKLSIDSEITND